VISYIIQRGHWRDIILNAHTPTEAKMITQRTEELEHVFNQLSKSRMKILLGDFNAKLERDVYKPTIRIKSLHETINDYGVRVVNLAMLEKSYCQE
jgi:hypothetical protein